MVHVQFRLYSMMNHRCENRYVSVVYLNSVVLLRIIHCIRRSLHRHYDVVRIEHKTQSFIFGLILISNIFRKQNYFPPKLQASNACIENVKLSSGNRQTRIMDTKLFVSIWQKSSLHSLHYSNFQIYCFLYIIQIHFVNIQLNILCEPDACLRCLLHNGINRIHLMKFYNFYWSCVCRRFISNLSFHFWFKVSTIFFTKSLTRASIKLISG